MKRGYMKRLISLVTICLLGSAMALAAPAHVQRVKTNHHPNHHKAHKAGKHHAAHRRHHSV